MLFQFHAFPKQANTQDALSEPLLPTADGIRTTYPSVVYVLWSQTSALQENCTCHLWLQKHCKDTCQKTPDETMLGAVKEHLLRNHSTTPKRPTHHNLLQANNQPITSIHQPTQNCGPQYAPFLSSPQPCSVNSTNRVKSSNFPTDWSKWRRQIIQILVDTRYMCTW